MDIKKMSDALIVTSTVLWAVCCVLAWNALYLEALWLGVIIIGIYLTLGMAKNGLLPVKIFIYPILIWAIIWIGGFWGADHLATEYKGVMPPYTILGMHPSFAVIVLTYWVGGIVTIALGFLCLRDEWLSKKDWNAFREKIQKLR
jgi:hypothetical protein